MTARDFEPIETEVILFYKSRKKFIVKAETREEAHKKAYNLFMDSSPEQIFSESEIENDFIETTIEGEEGSDMLHG